MCVQITNDFLVPSLKCGCLIWINDFKKKWVTSVLGDYMGVSTIEVSVRVTFGSFSIIL